MANVRRKKKEQALQEQREHPKPPKFIKKSIKHIKNITWY